jgi:hypothetical protein
MSEKLSRPRQPRPLQSSALLEPRWPTSRHAPALPSVTCTNIFLASSNSSTPRFRPSWCTSYVSARAPACRRWGPPRTCVSSVPAPNITRSPETYSTTAYAIAPPWSLFWLAPRAPRLPRSGATSSKNWWSGRSTTQTLPTASSSRRPSSFLRSATPTKASSPAWPRPCKNSRQKRAVVP